MAEYKYRALGWQDDDIASLNVVDGTAADNQVELQITKQGEGGKIDGPAIKGTDGITIDKAADSEKIEISGSGCVQKSTNTTNALLYAHVVGEEVMRSFSYYPGKDVIPLFDAEGSLKGNMGAAPAENTLTNKKYTDDNYVRKVTTAKRVYVTDKDGLADTAALAYSPVAYGLSAYDEGGRITTNEPVDNLDCANKKFVEDAIAASSTTLMVGIDSSLLGG